MNEERLFFSLFVLLIGVSIGMMLMQPDPGVTEPDQGETVTVPDAAGDNASTDLPDLFDAVEDSVVMIRAEGVDPEEAEPDDAQGSGFVYDNEGHIVTNDHVVAGEDEVRVVFSTGDQVVGEVVGNDVYSDLAVVRVDMDELDDTFRPLQLGDYDRTRVGQQAVAIGNPFGYQGTMTSGIVSQKDRLLRTEGGFSIPNVIQTDAAINPGNSGGPLLNSEGEVIGVNTAISSRDGRFAGVGFSISVKTVQRVVPQLIEEGQYDHPWIGVSGIDVNPDIVELMDLDVNYGFLVVDVADDSPAEEAGLRAGDQEVMVEGSPVIIDGDVIVGIGDERVRQIEDILNHLAQETEVGDTVEMEIIRDGARETVSLTLMERPDAG